MLVVTKKRPSGELSAAEALGKIEDLDQKLYQCFAKRFQMPGYLSRALVSFQANKTRAAYRWYKYKEAFSASLIELLLHQYGITSGTLLDPFAGSGTTLFMAASHGIHAQGIELLPIGQQIICARQIMESQLTPADVMALEGWFTARPWHQTHNQSALCELRITKGAYPKPTQQAIEKYIAAAKNEKERVQAVLRFALLCVLESVSYTRKDGQYLRWDYRSGRQLGKKRFDKGQILGFDQAITTKLQEIFFDLQNPEAQMGLFAADTQQGAIALHQGSCLDILPTLPSDEYDAIFTSPPYCNRYDYTRTYALELALLGLTEEQVVHLRQQMLSCTVENRAKNLLALNPQWKNVIAAADEQELLQTILKYLEDQKARKELNNNGIPRMVRGYFYEMACVMAEGFRVLKPQAPLILVNDNVRYAGASISVDLILSAIAERIGFQVESILILPTGKGNSSQQMGKHGREPLRKCIYIWRKP